MFQKFQEREQTHRHPHSFIQCHRKKKKRWMEWTLMIIQGYVSLY